MNKNLKSDYLIAQELASIIECLDNFVFIFNIIDE